MRFRHLCTPSLQRAMSIPADLRSYRTDFINRLLAGNFKVKVSSKCVCLVYTVGLLWGITSVHRLVAGNFKARLGRLRFQAAAPWALGVGRWEGRAPQQALGIPESILPVLPWPSYQPAYAHLPLQAMEQLGDSMLKPLSAWHSPDGSPI